MTSTAAQPKQQATPVNFTLSPDIAEIRALAASRHGAARRQATLSAIRSILQKTGDIPS